MNDGGSPRGGGPPFLFLTSLPGLAPAGRTALARKVTRFLEELYDDGPKEPLDRQSPPADSAQRRRRLVPMIAHKGIQGRALAVG